jgi:hypothetical protein
MSNDIRICPQCGMGTKPTLSANLYKCRNKHITKKEDTLSLGEYTQKQYQEQDMSPDTNYRL